MCNIMPQPQLHAWSCKSLTAYNFCYEYAKDFYFQVDQKYEIIYPLVTSSIFFRAIDLKLFRGLQNS